MHPIHHIEPLPIHLVIDKLLLSMKYSTPSKYYKAKDTNNAC